MSQREKEIGIYRSLGEKSSNIRSQILVEMLIIGLIALLISMSLSYPLAEILSEGLVVEEMLYDGPNFEYDEDFSWAQTQVLGS